MADKSPSPAAITAAEVPASIETAAAKLGIDNRHISEKGADAALGYVREGLELDSVTARRVLRKIDYHILPWLMALYFLQYLDKIVLSYSAVMGIRTDANLTNDQFTWTGSIFYFGFLIAAFPHNRMLQMYAPSKYTAVCVLLWGIVLTCMAAAKSFEGLMAQRFFLGCLEAVVSCAFLLITAAWYQKYEHGRRLSFWACCNGLASIVGALIAYGCVAGMEKHPNGHITSWQTLALCTGLFTVVYGAAMWWFMAPSIVEAKFLNEEEKAQAIERLRENQQGIGSKQFKWYQFREAFMDIRTWIYVLYILTSQIPAGGLSLLSSVLIKSLGYDTKTTLLLGMPQGAIQIIMQISLGFIADKTRKRTATALGGQLIALFSVCLLVGLGNVGPLYKRTGQLIAYFLMIGTCAPPYFIVLSMVSSNTLGTTKKATTNGIVFVSLAVAFLVGPKMFNDPPYYHRTKYICIGLWCAAIFLLCALWALNHAENKKRDREMAANPVEPPAGIEFMDLTDMENKLFRYVA